MRLVHSHQVAALWQQNHEWIKETLVLLVVNVRFINRSCSPALTQFVARGGTRTTAHPADMCLQPQQQQRQQRRQQQLVQCIV